MLFVVKGTSFEKHTIINKLNHFTWEGAKNEGQALFLTVSFLSPNSHHDHESRPHTRNSVFDSHPHIDSPIWRTYSIKQLEM